MAKKKVKKKALKRGSDIQPKCHYVIARGSAFSPGIALFGQAVSGGAAYPSYEEALKCAEEEFGSRGDWCVVPVWDTY